jgi:hypothetical protein
MNAKEYLKINNFQTTYKFRVYIPTIPLFTGNVNNLLFSVLIKTMEIPQKERAYSIYYYLGGLQRPYPHRITHEASLSWVFNFDETHELRDIISLWFRDIDKIGVNGYNPRATAYVELLNLDETVTNKVIKIEELIPRNNPAIENLDINATDAHIEQTLMFAYTNIDDDPENVYQAAWNVNFMV